MCRLSILAAALAAATVLPGAANAMTCYSVLDSTDNTIYQDTQPPVDMSETGAAAREAMRARKDFLTVSETDKCPQVTAPLGATGYRTASVDEIVGGMREFAKPGGAAPSSGRGAAAKAAPAPAARSSSMSGRKY
jgi:hypothetical protein